MDPQNADQKVPRCDLCEENVAQMYCSFCPTNLCKLCVGEHISDVYSKHNVVPLNMRKSTLLYPHCKIHSEEHCETLCEDCNIPVCSKCVASIRHERHQFVCLKALVNFKKKCMEKEKMQLQETIISSLKEIVSDLKSELGGIDGKYEKLTSDVTKHGEDWHREIDMAIIKRQTEIQEMRDKHKDTLTKQLNVIEKLISDVKESISKIEKVLHSNELLESLSFEIGSDESIKFPPKLNVKLPGFTPQNIQGQCLQLFSILSPLSITSEEHGYTIKTPRNLSSPPVKPLLDIPKVIITIETGYGDVYHITCFSDEEFFTHGDDKTIRLYNIEGKLLKSIQTKSENEPADITVIRRGDVVYSDAGTRTVNIVKNRKIDEVIRLYDWIPHNICSISCGDLLVFMSTEDKQKSKVVRYSDFKEKQSFQVDDQGKPLYSIGNLKHISENRNLDICVADNGAKAVVVVNQTGKLRFRYTGHPSRAKKSFDPVGISTDSQAQILIAECDNNCILVLDRDGKFLRYIDNCDLLYPWGVCVDKGDNLFVAESSGKVKKIKYI